MPKKDVQVEHLDPEALRTLVNKRWGDNTMRFGDDPYFQIKRIPTGLLAVDYELGGGLARGRHVEVYGGYAVGKTLLTYHAIASAQKLGLPCLFVDIEGTFDPAFAANAGVDLKRLALHEQEHGERAVDFMETNLRAGDYGVMVLDSIASLLPKTELEDPMDAGSYGTHQAKLMSKALRKLTAANRTTVLIYINQLREALGVVFGKRMKPTGGRSMEFYASTRLELSKTETLKHKGYVVNAQKGTKDQKDVPIGHRVLVRVEKDKTGGSYHGATTHLVYDRRLKDFDPVEDIIYLGLREDVVLVKGAGSGSKWMVEGYEEEAKVGRERFVKWLRKNVAVQEDIWQRITETQDDEDPGLPE